MVQKRQRDSVDQEKERTYHCFPAIHYQQRRKCIANKGAPLDWGDVRSFHQSDHAIFLPVRSSANRQTASCTNIVLPPQTLPHLSESEAEPNDGDEVDCARVEAEPGKWCYRGEDILIGCDDGGDDHLE